MIKERFFDFTVVIVVCLFIFSASLVPTAFAEEDGGDVLLKDTKRLGYVLFSHQKHKEAGNKCENCHPKIFKKEIGSSDTGNAITMKTLRKGAFCGQCHNGKKAFKVMSKCKKCHSVAK